MVAYLDNAASGPLHPAAAAAMWPWLGERFGNPSGSHQVARAARAAVDDARDEIAALLGIEPGGVTFTSGGTESDNLAVLGVVGARPGPVVVSAIEHPAVLAAAEASGREVRVAPVTAAGVLDLDALGPLLDATVSLVSVQLVNNETGAVQPLADAARLVRRRAPRALVHTDAVQAAAWMDLASAAAAADLVSISGHKLGGPQGVGALGARAGVPALRPVLHGGGQERELRSGTHNVAGIVGLGAAAAALARERAGTAERVAGLRDRLAAGLRRSVPGIVETCASVRRAPGHLHVRVPGVEGEVLVALLDEAGVCASSGAACASGATEPSPVLLAMGVPKEEAQSGLRLSLGAATTEEDVEHALRAVPAAVARLRGRRAVPGRRPVPGEG